MRSPNSETEPRIIHVVDKRPLGSKPEPKIVRFHDGRAKDRAQEVAHRKADA